MSLSIIVSIYKCVPYRLPRDDDEKDRDTRSETTKVQLPSAGIRNETMDGENNF